MVRISQRFLLRTPTGFLLKAFAAFIDSLLCTFYCCFFFVVFGFAFTRLFFAGFDCCFLCFLASGFSSSTLLFTCSFCTAGLSGSIFSGVRTSVYFLRDVCTYVRVTSTLTKQIRDNLFFAGGFGLIVYQHIP